MHLDIMIIIDNQHSTKDMELAKIAQGGVKLHFLGGSPNIEKFVNIILNFHFGSTFRQFQLFCEA